jgi:methyl-accepting chemotaxis protein
MKRLFKVFVDMRVSFKLFAGFGFVNFLISIYFIITLINLNTEQQRNRELNKSIKVKTLLLETKLAIKSDNLYLHDLVEARNLTILDAKYTAYKKQSSSIELNFNNIINTLKELSIEDLIGQTRDESIREIEIISTKYKTSFTDPMDSIYKLCSKSLMQKGVGENQQESEQIEELDSRMINYVIPLYNELSSLEAKFSEKVLDVLQSKSMEMARRAKIAMILNYFIILLGAFIVTIVFTNLIKRPLMKCVNLANSIATGDLTKKVELKSDDEFGMLGNSLDSMSRKLNDIAKNVITSSNNIKSVSEELNQSSQEISQGASEQAATTEEISTTLEDYSDTITQNASNALSTKEKSEDIARHMNTIEEYARNSTEAVRAISGKIDFINEIAFQTNILSLNAAVEAARAGSMGSGFSVIANEVRVLAEKSKTEAAEIIKLTKQCVKLSEMTTERIRNIMPEVTNQSALVQNIAIASETQTRSTEQILMSMQQLNAVVQQNASASEEMAGSSEELTAQAEYLTDMVGFFKINKE